MRRLLVAFLFLPLVAQAGFPFSFWKSSDPQPPTPFIWYDASQFGLADGATVTVLTDRMGVQNALRQATNTLRCTYAKYGLNGRGVVTYPGATEDRFGTGGGSGLIAVRPMTLAVVVNNTATTLSGPSQTVVASNVASPGLTFQLTITSPGMVGMNIARTFTATMASLSNVFAANTWHLVVFVVNTTTWSIWVDGVQVGSGSDSNGVAPNNFDVNYEVNTFNPLQGQMADTLYYRYAFSAADQAQLHTYSQVKWGTP